MTDSPAVRVVDGLAAAAHTLAVAESLTGGAVCVALTEAPGTSKVLRGGVVAYATPIKSELLGVDAALLARTGPVTAEVAELMAQGVRARLGASVGIATTGEAGPDSATGAPPGKAFVAVASDRGVWVDEIFVDGDRAEVQRGTRDAVLRLLLAVLDEL